MHKKLLAFLLSLTLILLPLGAAQGAMIGNTQLLNGTAATAQSELMNKLELDQVQQQLAQLGVDKEVLKQRLAQMTDEEITSLNQRLGELPAGGDALGVILVVFIVFVITDAIGATDLFPFIHPVR